MIVESAGDLWSAQVPQGDSDGTLQAWRLTSGAGSERWPIISPDGALVAFVAEYDGNPEVYVMPVTGGAPRRLTFHPGRDIPLGWTPDGREVLFRSQREHPLGRWELFRVPVDGGAAVREPLGECSLASIDPATGRIAFTRWSNEGWNWRGYRGGTAPDIWIAAPDRRSFTRLTTTESNELFPVWSNGRVAFLSDEQGQATIVSDRPEGGDRRVLLPVDGADFDVRRLSADAEPGSSRLIFARGCRVGVLETATGAVRTFDLALMGDRLDERLRLVDPMAALTAISLAPDGSLAALESRGEILLVPTGDPKPGEVQRVRQIPVRSDTRDSGVAWVKTDGVLFVSDRDGVPRLVLRTWKADGPDQERVISTGLTEWIFPPRVTADASRAAYGDKSLRLHLVDLASGADRVVATAESGEITDYRFSPDGRLLAWVEPHRTGYSRIRILSIDSGDIATIGDGMTMDLEPRWDPAGKYLYFLSRRHIDPLLDAFEFNFVNLNPVVVCALPLDSKTPPPLRAVAAAAGFDLEAWASADSDDEDGGEPSDDGKQGAKASGPAPASSSKSAPGANRTIEPIVLDPVDMARRVVILDIEPGELDGLEAIPGGMLYLRRAPPTLNAEIWPPPPLGVPGATLHRVTLIDGKDEPLVEAEVSAYAVSADGSTAIAAEGSKLLLGRLNEPPSEPGKEFVPLDLHGARLAIDVRAEWAQIFDDAWRLQRDFFWRDDFGGVDWQAVRARYAALVPRIGSRTELNELIGQMMGELGTSHLYIGGGDDFEKAKPVSVGMLGIDVERRGDSLVITRVLPDFSAAGGEASPLAAPHLGVKAGMVLQAINGRALDPARDPREQLVGLGGQKVLVTIAAEESSSAPRSFEITTIEDEQPLRYRDWVESNRRSVSERSGGRLGYLHLPDMDADGLTAFVRQFYPQLDRAGLVIDVRDNGGGFVSQMVIERLARRIYAWTLPRHGTPETYPQRVMDGPMAVIIDQNAGSDGDIFPESFRLRSLGPLVGTRTWGGVIGIRQDKPFVDGGSSSQPEYAWWEPLRGFSLENTGVSPDVVVEITPEDRQAGRDPQLDRTVDLLLEALRDRPATPRPPRPPPGRAAP